MFTRRVIRDTLPPRFTNHYLTKFSPRQQLYALPMFAYILFAWPKCIRTQTCNLWSRLADSYSTVTPLQESIWQHSSTKSKNRRPIWTFSNWAGTDWKHLCHLCKLGAVGAVGSGLCERGDKQGYVFVLNKMLSIYRDRITIHCMVAGSF